MKHEFKIGDKARRTIQHSSRSREYPKGYEFIIQEVLNNVVVCTNGTRHAKTCIKLIVNESLEVKHEPKLGDVYEETMKEYVGARHIIICQDGRMYSRANSDLGRPTPTKGFWYDKNRLGAFIKRFDCSDTDKATPPEGGSRRSGDPDQIGKEEIYMGDFKKGDVSERLYDLFDVDEKFIEQFHATIFEKIEMAGEIMNLV